MELNLRKARKLEAKILSYVDAMQLESSVRVRVLANDAERAAALSAGRQQYLSDIIKQKSLVVARFSIRQSISDANQAVGINALINQRETLQALLSKSNAGVDVLNIQEANDLAGSKKSHLEKGGNGYSEASVAFPLPVALKEDSESFKLADSFLKKELEEIEDQLSQKNLGAKIKLDEQTVDLLQSVGLV